ncbi:JAB domain-containing protein, partial [Escherichia coli]
MQQLSFLPGAMTPGERSLIQRALKTLDRHLHEPGVAFTSTRAAREWLILNMAGLEREEFRVLYLNNQNQLIAGEEGFTGNQMILIIQIQHPELFTLQSRRVQIQPFP